MKMCVWSWNLLTNDKLNEPLRFLYRCYLLRATNDPFERPVIKIIHIGIGLKLFRLVYKQ